MNRLTLTVVAAFMLALASQARAQSGNDALLAEELYREAREMMDQKRYEEACKKFAESNRLDPATGTLLNLASCHEALGRTATAWAEFGEALLAARRDQRSDRVQFAEERIQALEPKLSRLSVVVPAEARLEGLEVRIDGKVIGAAAWGVSAPTDPGLHRIEASAPGRKSWSSEVSVGAQADKKSISVPFLEEDPNARQIEPMQTQTTPPSTVPPAADALALERPVPASVFIAGGATLALTAAAAISGAVYLSKRSEYEDSRSTATAERQTELRDAAKTPGVVNVVTTGAAVLGAALTGYFYFSRPTQPTQARRLRVDPWVGARAGGFVVEGNL
jgi:tetratricopeptide (TPR) repeat protein